MSIAKRRYDNHKGKAKSRGIPFLITFTEWYYWWLSNGVDKNDVAYNHKMCMCRVGDTGPYALNNIYCATRSQNTKDAHNNNTGILKGRKKGQGTHLGYTGAKGSDSLFAKTIVTPRGTFGSRKEAIMAYKVDSTTMSRWLKNKPTEFYYKEVQ